MKVRKVMGKKRWRPEKPGRKFRGFQMLITVVMSVTMDTRTTDNEHKQTLTIGNDAVILKNVRDKGKW